MSNTKIILTDKIEITIDTISIVNESQQIGIVDGLKKRVTLNGKLIYEEFAQVSQFKMSNSINDILNTIRTKTN